VRYLFVSIVFLISVTEGSSADSPYVGQESRGIKALSSQEISGYLSGHGMGLAKAAELNGYPGPAHVLELAEELELTGEQTEQTEALFQLMKSSAVSLGEELLEEERALDQMFASGAVTPDSLASALARISRLQGEIRRVHLDTHLQQTAILSSAQIEAYAEFRGYETTGAHEHSAMKHH